MTEPFNLTLIARPGTLAVEAHHGLCWLVEITPDGPRRLAHFTDADAADRFKALVQHGLMAAHAAGASGI